MPLIRLQKVAKSNLGPTLRDDFHAVVEGPRDPGPRNFMRPRHELWGIPDLAKVNRVLRAESCVHFKRSLLKFSSAQSPTAPRVRASTRGTDRVWGSSS